MSGVIQVQGAHHITLNGADRETSIAFWSGLLGMPLVAEQPNLDQREINHLYFDCGDGRLLTVFTDESRAVDASPNVNDVGSLHHLALTVDRATFLAAPARLEARGITHSGPKDRGFMESLYFRDPLGQLIELACWTFTPPPGVGHGRVMARANALRAERGAGEIAAQDLADAVADLSAAHPSAA